MADQNPGAEARLVAELNDLLQLEYDAVRAYTFACENLRGEPLRLAVRVFRGDHERHMGDLAGLVRARGADPVEASQVSAGAFEQAIRAAAGEGDAGMLEALRVNETRVRGRYRELIAAELPVDGGGVMQRLVADEERHWAWLGQALQALGVRLEATVGVAPPAEDAASRRGPEAAVPAAAAAEAAPSLEATVTDRAEEMAGAGTELVAGTGAAAVGGGGGIAVSEGLGRPAAATLGGEGGIGRGPEELPSVGSVPAGRTGERARTAAGATGERALAAGSGLEEAARGLDRAASWARQRGGGFARVGPPAHRAARVLAREGTNLRRQDVAAVKRDVEGGVFEHPIGAVLLAAGLGYILGRLLR